MRAAPIILTLQLDAVSSDFFERQRQLFFPEGLNRVPAHLTLFHKLPGDEHEAIVKTVAAAARPPFMVSVDGLKKLGRGVAYTLSAPELLQMHRTLAAAFAPWLTGQDRERFRPHITVQNKASPGAAQRTFEDLSRAFTPFSATAQGVQLWHYAGGPWSPLGVITFTAPTRQRGAKHKPPTRI